MNNGEKNKKINFSHNDINTDLYNLYKDSSYLAVDTEAMGLIHGRDRLCLIQICDELNLTSCIKIDKNNSDSPNIRNLFETTDRNIVISDGSVIAEGTSRELLNNSKAVSQYFGKDFTFK